VPHNVYKEAHQRSIDHIDKSHEDPHSGHNKDIVVEDSMNHMDKSYSFHCSPVPTHNEAGTETDNHNQIENHFHMNHTSKSRMWGVEGDHFHTACTYTIDKGNPQQKEYKEKGVIFSGCSRHITGNKCYLTEYEDYDGGFVSFGDGKVITYDFSRFSLVFFLATKDETSWILKTFITGIEKQLDCKVNVIRSDNGTEFKNSVMNQFCDMKGIKREFSVARTPQQNGVAKKKNKTLIEAARTMLVDSELPTTFWEKAVNTTCYLLNKALVIKPHNKTTYELIRGSPPLINFMKPFGYPITILNTKDYLGKFDEKADEGFFVGYSVVRNGSDWLFDIDSLTISINYVPVVTGFQTNGIVGTKDNIVTGQAKKNKEPKQDTVGPSFVNAASPSPLNAAGTPASTIAFEEHLFERFYPFKNAFSLPHVPIVTPINDTGIFGNAYDDDAVKEEVDMNNVVSSYTILDAPLTKFLKDHPKDQVIGNIETHVQTRLMTKMNEEHGLISSV
nr:hypothetical protein [Tanacetum cinerariifolium]